MATKINIDATHASGYPSNLVAQQAGHIQSVVCSEDFDNMTIVALGDFVDLDVYEDDGTVVGFEAEIVKKAQNGNWYVRVKNPGNAYLVYQKPLIAEEYSNKFQLEARFFNAKGDLARAYQLHTDDVFEVSAAGFKSGTPAAKATISSIDAATHKMVIA